MDENEKILQHCLANRAEGRLKYSLRHGLIFGVISFFCTGLINLFDHSFKEAFFSPNALIGTVILTVVFTIAYATLFWWVNEKTILRLQK